MRVEQEFSLPRLRVVFHALGGGVDGPQQNPGRSTDAGARTRVGNAPVAHRCRRTSSTDNPTKAHVAGGGHPRHGPEGLETRATGVAPRSAHSQAGGGPR